MGRDSINPFVLWGNLLLDDPGAGLDDLLSGRRARGAQQRAEPEDFLADLLAHPIWAGAKRERLIRNLDRALLNWLKARFDWSLSDIGTFGTRAYAAQMSDALTVAARLPLTDTAQDLIDDQATWDNRFRGLRWPGDIDLLRQFNLVLARHQADTRFVSRWFATCDDAAWGSPHWRTDLNTGLLGLRKLPVTADTEPESRVVAALARFGALAFGRGMDSLEVGATIRRRAAALTVLYPRHEGHWQDVWGRVLENPSSSVQKDASAMLARWLGHEPTRGGAGDVRPPGGRQRVADRIAGHRASLPDAERRHRIEGKIQGAQSLYEKLWKEVQKLIREHWLYASVSGETYYAVRTTHKLYDQSLRLRPARAYLAEMHVLILQAIEAVPGNSYVWDLWAKVLSALGRDEASLSVRWESIRRFPENCVLRSSLAEALRDHGRMPLAEHLLRETMRDFPNNEACRNILAGLLISTERKSDAEHLLRETMRDFPTNEVCRNILAGLLISTERKSDAEHLLRETMRDFPNDEVCRSILARLLISTERKSEAEHLLRETMRDFPNDEVCRGILARLLISTGRRAEAEDLLREAIRNFPKNEVFRNMLDELSSTTERHEDRGAEIDAATEGRLAAPGQTEEQEIEGDSGGIESAIRTYLGRLTNHVPLLEAYFAPSASAGDAGALSGTPSPETAPHSELALVVAHRAGRMEGPGREYLETWARARPSSYSARLLLAWRGREGNGLDRAAMSGISADFPENRHWNKWLCYGFVSGEERGKLRQEAMNGGDGNGKTSWRERLSAVYPDLQTEGESNEDGMGYDPAAMKRLLEDVAFAGADRTVPSIPLP